MVLASRVFLILCELKFIFMHFLKHWVLKTKLVNFFSKSECVNFSTISMTSWLAKPRSVCLHSSSAGYQKWGQDDGLAECAICGAENSATSGNSGLNILIRPRQFRNSQSEFVHPILFYLISLSDPLSRVFQGVLP